MGIIKAILKKYAALLPPVGLLLLAGILLIPTLWLGGKVRAQMANSTRQAGTIRSLSGQVPSRGKPAEAKRYMDQLEAEANQIDALMRQSSQRELVSYRSVIFPEPTETSDQIFVQFGKDYTAAITGMLTAMNASDAPSEAEIRSRTGGRTGVGAVGGAGYGAYGGTRQAAAKDPIIDALCTERAERIAVYAAPSAFLWYDFWQNFTFEGRESAIRDCWNSQTAFWIYEDIAKTIQTMNAGSTRVSTSPVKRLLGVSFSGPVQISDAMRPGGMPAGTRGGGQTTAVRDEPNYVFDASAIAGGSGGMTGTAMAGTSVFLPKSWTGRMGNTDIDVIHFAVSVLVDSRQTLAFMRELCSEKEHTFREEFKADGRQVSSRHNQITILQNSISVVEPDNPLHELYRYGSGATMQLDLVCEYVLDRRGYDAIKPTMIKQALGQADASQTGDGSSGQSGGYGMPMM